MFWKKRKETGATRTVIFFASDLHGSNICFKKFVNAAKFYGATALIMGGDLTGKAVIPITKQSDGSYLGFQAGAPVVLNDSAEIDEFSKKTGNMGFYPVEMSEDEFQVLKDDTAGQARLFKELVIKRVEEWCEYAGKVLGPLGVPLITSPGNDDFLEIDEVMNRSPHVDFHEMEVSELDGYEILHCGGSNPTPWDTEREYSEEEYLKKFSELTPQVKNMERCIFNIHVPPYGTILDACPQLDHQQQVVFEAGNPVQMHAGSTAVLNVINETQPLLALHGHIHEGRGNIKIGRTTCVNPGSVYPEGLLQGVLMTLSDGEIEQVQLTQG
jgi:Icc-related predicted phosphoesterase